MIHWIFFLSVWAGSNQLIFVLRNQATKLGKQLGTFLEESLISQTIPAENLLQVSELEDSFNKWWYFPILTDVQKLLHKRKAKWAVFLEPNCDPSVFEIIKLLTAYDSSKPYFLGEHVLDLSPAIIHHYNMDKTFFYPDRHKGFLLSKAAIDDLIKLLGEVPAKWSFHIDAIFELTKFLREKMELKLTEVSLKTRLRAFLDAQNVAKLMEQITWEDIAVAVKTASIFHGSRVPITQELWGNAIPNIIYYSDAEDSSIPTVSTNLPNAERGHCKKTEYIMTDLLSRFPNCRWFLITDDDTILNPERLISRLRLYDSRESMHIGEKYGFALNPESTRYGYTYITGGGGMLWTKSALKQMVECESCTCSLTEPDDMRIGMWGKSLRIPLVHDPAFHQAQPEHYHPTRLEGEPEAVSFHKHSGKLSPSEVLQQYLSSQKSVKQEL